MPVDFLNSRHASTTQRNDTSVSDDSEQEDKRAAQTNVYVSSPDMEEKTLEKQDNIDSKEDNVTSVNTKQMSFHKMLQKCTKEWESIEKVALEGQRNFSLMPVLKILHLPFKIPKVHSTSFRKDLHQ